MRSVAYFSRQWRDHLVTRGPAMLFVATFFGLDALLGHNNDPGFLRLALSRALTQMSPFLVMIATYGIIGSDARQGHFRLLFSKPISPVWYYAQALVASWLTYSIALLLFIGVFAVAQAPVWPTDALLGATITFLLCGALVFGVSRFTRLDWLVGGVLLLFGVVLRSAYPASESVYGKMYNVILPPSHLGVSDVFLSAGGVDVGHALWIVCYAGLFIILGLAAVRLVSFGTAR